MSLHSFKKFNGFADSGMVIDKNFARGLAVSKDIFQGHEKTRSETSPATPSIQCNRAGDGICGGHRGGNGVFSGPMAGNPTLVDLGISDLGHCGGFPKPFQSGKENREE